MIVGLCNALATFQWLVSRVISGLNGCVVYLDDAVVYSHTWDEHPVYIRLLFEQLVELKLTLNLAKCEFARVTVVYLGNVVGQGQVRPVRGEILAIDHFPPPSTKIEVKQKMFL